ncbi:hypothetical protein DXX93_20030 [Thalassotalea euphylliae]|uniref:Uncharacterized protein n=1 Tax=Thalassotalea euphylliae TaxID=1655234 RepID=A0A3E0TW82_9GAMM|nr:hypothetical protein [Thalassotalea euphylliae]REL28627.1 hypothetical protein DXX93_20030 [Thalassotalea euphylliae]
MACECCGVELSSGTVIRVDAESGHTYKACPHCSATHGSEHVFHQYPYAFGKSPAGVTSANPNGFQSYCSGCRSLSPELPSRNYKKGRTCSNLR